MDHLSWKLMLLVTSGRLCYYSRLDSCHRKPDTHTSHILFQVIMWCRVAVECHWWRPSSTISVGHIPTSPTCMCTTLKRINFIHVNFTVLARVFPDTWTIPTFHQAQPANWCVSHSWSQLLLGCRAETHGTKTGRASTLITVITVIVESWADLSVFHLVLIYVLCLWSQMGWHRYLRKAAWNWFCRVFLRGGTVPQTK